MKLLFGNIFEGGRWHPVFILNCLFSYMNVRQCWALQNLTHKSLKPKPKEGTKVNGLGAHDLQGTNFLFISCPLISKM